MLAVTACSSTGTATAPSSGPQGSQPAGIQVTVRMTEFQLALPQHNLAPGTYTFTAVNAGQTEHALEIAGPDVAGKRTPIVEPGQSAKLTVTLEPGSYEMYCPVDGHKGEGMDTNLTVNSVGETGGSAPGPGAGIGGSR
jgi:plastocyanin